MRGEDRGRRKERRGRRGPEGRGESVNVVGYDLR